MITPTRRHLQMGRHQLVRPLTDTTRTRASVTGYPPAAAAATGGGPGDGRETRTREGGPHHTSVRHRPTPRAPTQRTGSLTIAR